MGIWITIWTVTTTVLFYGLAIRPSVPPLEGFVLFVGSIFIFGLFGVAIANVARAVWGKFTRR